MNASESERMRDYAEAEQGAPLRAVVVDDEPLARVRIRSLLAAHADVRLIAECADGGEALEVIARERPDVVFLDMQMTTLHGLDVARAIDESTAVVFVTAFAEYALRAFDVSAVDYLLKPFDETRFEQALARARAHAGSVRTREAHARLLERVQEMEEDGVTPRRRTVIRVADIEIDVGAYEVRRAGAPVALRPKLVDLLAALARRAGEVLTRQELLQEVWGYQSDVVSRTLDTHMVTLRQRLGHTRDEPGYIETVLKVGYRMRM